MKDTKWKIPKTWYDRLADWMGVGFLAASGFYLWANWQASPRDVPYLLMKSSAALNLT